MRALIALLLLSLGAGAAAQPAPAGDCRINVTPINFGPYSALDPFPSFALGRVIVVCRASGSFPTRVTLSSGRSGNPHQRRMVRGTAALEYNIYTDPRRRQVAGDGSGGTAPLEPRLRSINRNVFVMFGVIPAQQSVEAGEYHDQLRIVLEF